MQKKGRETRRNKEDANNEGGAEAKEVKKVKSEATREEVADEKRHHYWTSLPAASHGDVEGDDGRADD
jgi:hypothetical protein